MFETRLIKRLLLIIHVSFWYNTLALELGRRTPVRQMNISLSNPSYFKDYSSIQSGAVYSGSFLYSQQHRSHVLQANLRAFHIVFGSYKVASFARMYNCTLLLLPWQSITMLESVLIGSLW